MYKMARGTVTPIGYTPKTSNKKNSERTLKTIAPNSHVMKLLTKLVKNGITFNNTNPTHRKLYNNAEQKNARKQPGNLLSGRNIQRKLVLINRVLTAMNKSPSPKTPRGCLLGGKCKKKTRVTPFSTF